MLKKILTFKKNNKLNLWELFLKFSISPIYFLRKLLNLSESNSVTYKRWIKLNEKENKEKIEIIDSPLFSIVIPTYNTNPIFLKECIQSVEEQTYTNFEICIADDCSTNSETIKTLKSLNSNKIKINFREKNGNISAATNSAISLCKGNYIVFLDHDDKLSRNALYEVAKLIREKPKVKFIYSDEDHIHENGKRHTPYFKSDFNEQLLYSQNYICHLMVVEAELVKKIGGMRLGYEGSQDHDFVLRAIAQIKKNQIFHIPKILYHWRQHKASFSREYLNKCINSSIKALEDYFKEKNVDVKVSEGLFPFSYKVEYPITVEPKVSLIIPTKDKVVVLKKCIDSILSKTKYKNYEIILINNGSIEKKTKIYLDEIKKIKNIKVLDYNFSFNYSAINNYAVKFANGEILGLINNDIEIISPNWLREMVGFAQKKEIGCVGAKLYYPNNTIQHAGVILGIGGVAGHSHRGFKYDEHGYFSRLKLIQNISAVTGACLLIRKEVYLELGGLNEKELKISFNDVDLCLKALKKGYKNLWTPYAELYHHESISRGYEDTPEKVKRFEGEIEYMKQEWKSELKQDPMYNPNLTMDKENFSLNI